MRPEFTLTKSGNKFSSKQAEQAVPGAVGCSFLGKLAIAKQMAFRRRVWYRVLNRIERGIVDLTMRYVNDVKSVKLAKVLTAIMEKLQSAMESTLDKLVRTVGLLLAKKISDIAVSWGNLLASKWADDVAFARFLMLNSAKSRSGLES